MTTEQAMTLYVLIANFVWLQGNVCLIGNRQYSMHYKSHFLVKKQGIMSLIYFKPKHFHRFSIWEVVGFFLSYIETIVLGLLLALSFKIEIDRVVLIVAYSTIGFSIISEVIRIFYIDISRHIEEKNMRYKIENYCEDINIKNKKLFNSMISYSKTIRYKIDSLYEKKIKEANGNKDVIDKIDEEFIHYYRNYKNVSFENNNVIYSNKVCIRYEILCIFDSKKREKFPDLNSGIYRPHIVINGDNEYLGIEFETSKLKEFDKEDKAIIRSLYNPDMYEKLIPGVLFTIREGRKIVGNGRVESIVFDK
ncbi:MAG: hypothetical protein K6E20_00090 [Acholeplasmatales bacterium]|nr:hypothetical protein [Acholeplasmatales bacterium]